MILLQDNVRWHTSSKTTSATIRLHSSWFWPTGPLTWSLPSSKQFSSFSPLKKSYKESLLFWWSNAKTGCVKRFFQKQFKSLLKMYVNAETKQQLMLKDYTTSPNKLKNLLVFLAIFLSQEGYHNHFWDQKENCLWSSWNLEL